MNRLKLAVRLESLGLPLRPALMAAQRFGVEGVQVDAVGDLSPKTLSETGRREFLYLLRSHNLELAALGCPLRHGLDISEGQDARIDHVQRVLSLSFDLGARKVEIQSGRLPEDPDTPRSRLLTEALLVLGKWGDRTGTVLALEAGLDSGKTMRTFLDRFDTGGLGVAFDPANLMMSGFDPFASARDLHGKIAYAHAKDARQSSPNRGAQEVPLGHGDIDWMGFLGLLEEVEYRGWLTIVRESGDSRQADVAAGVQFLRRFLIVP